MYLEEIPCALTQAIGLAGGELLCQQIEENALGDNEGMKTEQVTLGWKKIGPKWIKVPELTAKKDVSDKFQTSILLRDDFDTEAGAKKITAFQEALKDKLAVRVLSSKTLVNIEDCSINMSDEAQAARIAADTKFVMGEALPLTYNTDFNMISDESFSRIFFHGIAAPLIAKSEKVTNKDHLKYGPFVVDMEFMNTLDHRNADLFKTYGARIHFDENQMPTAIYDCDLNELVLPGEPKWEEAKFQAKASAFILTTAREHLAQSHLIVSNDASREIVQTLHPEHPIRRLLSIFTYNAVNVNNNAFTALTPDKSPIHRATNFSYKGMRQVFDNSYETSDAYEPFSKREIKNPAVEKLADEGKFPYLTEGREFYDLTRNFVTEWMEKAGDEASDEHALEFYEAMKESSKGQKYELPEYSAENMIDLMTQVMFTVTCYHELIGHLPDYACSPFANGFRVPREAPTQVDLQSWILGDFIIGSTSIPAPQLLAEFPNYIGVGSEKFAWERDVWTRYIAKMGIQSKKVQNDDRKRDFEFKYFDPSLFECSISV